MTTTSIGRRRLLRTAGLASAGTVTGFPMVWAQNIKNVTLRQFGTGVSNLNAVADKVKQDLGFTLQMTALDTDAVTQKAVTQPKSYDVADIEYFITKRCSPPACYSRWTPGASSCSTRSCRSSPPAS
jgi:putative spermidine/putrescine transport system substrate-binding protein